MAVSAVAGEPNQMVFTTLLKHQFPSAWQHLLMEALWSVPSTMFVLTLALRVCALMLPVMGRNGSDSPDYVIAILNTGIAAVVLCTVVSLACF